MKPATTAQRLLIALGVDPQTVMLGHYRTRSYQPRKRGPGRRHGVSR